MGKATRYKQLQDEHAELKIQESLKNNSRRFHGKNRKKFNKRERIRQNALDRVSCTMGMCNIPTNDKVKSWSPLLRFLFQAAESRRRAVYVTKHSKRVLRR